jgi:outer membrane protein OmpA-like peptidoglycan-associated protein
LIAKLRGGDLPGFFSLAGTGVSAAEQAKLTALFGERKYKLSATKPPAEASPGSYSVFLDAPADLAAAGEQSLKVALASDPVKGWSVASVVAPSIEAILAAKMAAEKKPEPAPAPVVKGPVDFARDFLNAVVARDFRTAKLAVDAEKLTDEKLAALFIVVEEGAFKPHDRNPLIGTAAGTDSAWVIARLKSEKEESDFGIEMKRAGEGDAAAWKVVGLNFSKLIQTAAAQAGAGNIAYAPIKTDLQDGDQLVLYFDYDNASVNPRAAKQLRIIADILREDPNKMIHINGHADALGTADYNEALSDSRAAAVREILLAHGIPGGQIVTKAFGFNAPKAPNVNPDGTDNPTGRAQNRRAEVYLAF